MNSKRKKALISGASSGIGAACARRFASEGYDVFLNALPESGLEAVRDSLAPGNHLIYAGDYADPHTANSIALDIHTNWSDRLDCLVNCAAMFSPIDAIDTPVHIWREQFDVIINGAVHLTRIVVPLMSEGGRIVHITSIHAERAEPKASAYSMAKAALNQYCRALAIELASRGINVNAIAPGFVDTPMSVVNGVNELETDWFREHYIEGHHLPLRRPAQPEEIAGVAFFLCGPDASYITGQVITVDGGLSITF